jgi:copper chaperone NosL
MLNHLKEVDTSTVALFLVNDYNAPGELIDAIHASYLKSKEIPSPMGEFLTAFGSRKDAEKAKSEHGGVLFTWLELQQKYGI